MQTDADSETNSSSSVADFYPTPIGLTPMLKDFDDWGMIRRDTGQFEASVRRAVSDEKKSKARASRTDPFEPLSLALIYTLEKIKDKDSFLLGLELATLAARSHGNRQTQIMKSTEAADWEKVNARAEYDAACKICARIKEITSLTDRDTGQ